MCLYIFYCVVYFRLCNSAKTLYIQIFMFELHLSLYLLDIMYIVDYFIILSYLISFPSSSQGVCQVACTETKINTCVHSVCELVLQPETLWVSTGWTDELLLFVLNVRCCEASCLALFTVFMLGSSAHRQKVYTVNTFPKMQTV